MNRSYSKIRHIQESNQKLERRIMSEQKQEENEGFWNDIFGKPSIKDATHTSLRGTGSSLSGKDNTDDDRHTYTMFNGQKFYEDEIEYADYNDMGDLPRIEDGKLIIANPVWSM